MKVLGYRFSTTRDELLREYPDIRIRVLTKANKLRKLSATKTPNKLYWDGDQWGINPLSLHPMTMLLHWIIRYSSKCDNLTLVFEEVYPTLESMTVSVDRSDADDVYQVNALRGRCLNWKDFYQRINKTKTKSHLLHIPVLEHKNNVKINSLNVHNDYIFTTYSDAMLLVSEQKLTEIELLIKGDITYCVSSVDDLKQQFVAWGRANILDHRILKY